MIIKCDMSRIKVIKDIFSCSENMIQKYKIDHYLIDL